MKKIFKRLNKLTDRLLNHLGNHLLRYFIILVIGYGITAGASYKAAIDGYKFVRQIETVSAVMVVRFNYQDDEAGWNEYANRVRESEIKLFDTEQDNKIFGLLSDMDNFKGKDSPANQWSDGVWAKAKLMQLISVVTGVISNLVGILAFWVIIAGGFKIVETRIMKDKTIDNWKEDFLDERVFPNEE